MDYPPGSRLGYVVAQASAASGFILVQSVVFPERKDAVGWAGWLARQNPALRYVVTEMLAVETEEPDERANVR